MSVQPPRSSPDRPSPSPLAPHWSLDPGVVFLNHGSFGATPRVVRESERAWRDRIEHEPVRFFTHDLWPALARARAELSPILRAPPNDWAFVANASAAVNAVVRSLALAPGDELVTSTHEYNACNNVLDYDARRAGAKVVRVAWPFPFTDPQHLIDLTLGALTQRTRFVLLSAVTSPTGFITPYERLVPAIQARGVDVMLDAAHGPGFLDLDLGALAPAYATGNFHKWLCAPKGSAFLYVRPDRQDGIVPPVISHGYNAKVPSPHAGSRFIANFDFAGTDDVSRYLATPDAARAVPALVRGDDPGRAIHAPTDTRATGHEGTSDLRTTWLEIIARNRALALRGREVLLAALGTPAPVPASMLGSMAAVMLPRHEPDLNARLRARPTLYHDALQDALVERHKVQVPIIPSLDGTKRWVRISAQVYNTVEQYEYLARALVEELGRERGL